VSSAIFSDTSTVGVSFPGRRFDLFTFGASVDNASSTIRASWAWTLEDTGLVDGDVYTLRVFDREHVLLGIKQKVATYGTFSYSYPSGPPACMQLTVECLSSSLEDTTGDAGPGP
jgi:hypothetical protein